MLGPTRLPVFAMMLLLSMVLLRVLVLMLYLHQRFFLLLGMVLVMMVFMILGSSCSRLVGKFAFGFSLLCFIVGLKFTFDCDKEVV